VFCRDLHESATICNLTGYKITPLRVNAKKCGLSLKKCGANWRKLFINKCGVSAIISPLVSAISICDISATIPYSESGQSSQQPEPLLLNTNSPIDDRSTLIQAPHRVVLNIAPHISTALTRMDPPVLTRMDPPRKGECGYCLMTPGSRHVYCNWLLGSNAETN
jgi:hypothetical protein